MFIARQPIFTSTRNVYGYELLYRDDACSTRYTGKSSQSSTAQVLVNLLDQGVETIVGSTRAFINFDHDFILSDTIELFDPSTIIIEVLETVEVDQILVQRINDLKSKGYIIALDDFIVEKSNKLLPTADIIKLDIIATPLDTIHDIVDWALEHNIIILAEKVETEYDFLTAKAMGFDLFQGFFFDKPKIIGNQSRKLSSKKHYSLILKELQSEEPSFSNIARIIETDVDLAYRLINLSSQNEGDEVISSISKALIRMGFTSLRRWISILLLQDLSQEKPHEILKISLIRSKFAEFIASKTKFEPRKHEICMAGLFSMLDVMLDSPMEVALKGLYLTDDVIDVLILKKGEFKPIYNIIYHLERTNWEKVREYAAEIGIEEIELSIGYLDSLKWTTQIFDSLYP